MTANPSFPNDTVKFASVTCLDLWAWTLTPWILTSLKRLREMVSGSQTEDTSQQPLPPRVLLIESEQWMRWREHQEFLSEMKEVWPTATSRLEYLPTPSTDHLSASDFGVITPMFGRRKYATLNFEVAIQQWVDQIAQHFQN